jgi:hypothetical protein
MKSVREIIEVINHEGKLKLDEVNIDGKDHSLEINNPNGMLTMSFNDGDYEIKIHNGSITFERHLSRPNHDHDDTEILQIAIDSGPGRIKGEIFWRSRFPYAGEGYDHFKVEFGSKIDKYP